MGAAPTGAASEFRTVGVTIESMSSRSDARAALGRAGERRAAWFYRLRGFSIVARNVSYRDGEIDLVVRRGRLVVFVEVKTRGQLSLGAPVEAVNRGKQLRIMKCAESWLVGQKAEGCDIRFDVLSLVRTRWRFLVEHFPAAFEARYENGRPWKRI